MIVGPPPPSTPPASRVPQQRTHGLGKSHSTHLGQDMPACLCGMPVPCSSHMTAAPSAQQDGAVSVLDKVTSSEAGRLGRGP